MFNSVSDAMDMLRDNFEIGETADRILCARQRLLFGFCVCSIVHPPTTLLRAYLATGTTGRKMHRQMLILRLANPSIQMHGEWPDCTRKNMTLGVVSTYYL
jgi:hypothetical protein